MRTYQIIICYCYYGPSAANRTEKTVILTIGGVTYDDSKFYTKLEQLLDYSKNVKFSHHGINKSFIMLKEVPENFWADLDVICKTHKVFKEEQEGFLEF